jgi:PadR family transcriptional regulator, regulatory protein PadR
VGHTLGTFELATLTAVFRLRDGAYGRTLHDELESRLQRAVSMGAMYNTLDRLQREGLLASRLVQGAGGRGGRSRRYYTINAEGIRALNHTRAAAEALWEGIRWPIKVHP